MSIAALDIDVNKGAPVDLKSYPRVREQNVASFLPPDGGKLSVETVFELGPVLPEWRDFERHALGTIYQNALWCRAWTETVGQLLGVQPVIVLARDSMGWIRFIVPLQIRRRQGVKVLEFLGSPHHNYGLGLFDQAFLPAAAVWFDDNWDGVLTKIGGIDAIALTEMPMRIAGFDHPMRRLTNLRAANSSFSLQLEPDFARLHARKKSAERRRAARKDFNALAQAGAVTFGLPANKTDLRALIEVMFDDQQSRLAELGVYGVLGAAERQFVQRLADLQDENDPILAPYHLTCGGKVLAVMLGGLHGNCYWALISSLAPGPLRKHSPGGLALQMTIEACCRRGLSRLDFSAGDASYKRAWADDVIEMRSIYRGRNLAGIVWAGAMAFGQMLKRQIKSSPALLDLSLALRRWLFARRI